MSSLYQRRIQRRRQRYEFHPSDDSDEECAYYDQAHNQGQIQGRRKAEARIQVNGQEWKSQQDRSRIKLKNSTINRAEGEEVLRLQSLTHDVADETASVTTKINSVVQSSQTEEQIILLEKSGKMKEIVGSQSVLSQELELNSNVNFSLKVHDNVHVRETVNPRINGDIDENMMPPSAVSEASDGVKECSIGTGIAIASEEMLFSQESLVDLNDKSDDREDSENIAREKTKSNARKDDYREIGGEESSRVDTTCTTSTEPVSNVKNEVSTSSSSPSNVMLNQVEELPSSLSTSCSSNGEVILQLLQQQSQQSYEQLIPSQSQACTFSQLSNLPSYDPCKEEENLEEITSNNGASKTNHSHTNNKFTGRHNKIKQEERKYEKKGSLEESQVAHTNSVQQKSTFGSPQKQKNFDFPLKQEYQQDQPTHDQSLQPLSQNLSQFSTLSACDLIIDAAHKLAERDGEVLPTFQQNASITESHNDTLNEDFASTVVGTTEPSCAASVITRQSHESPVPSPASSSTRYPSLSLSKCKRKRSSLSKYETYDSSSECTVEEEVLASCTTSSKRTNTSSDGKRGDRGVNKTNGSNSNTTKVTDQIKSEPDTTISTNGQISSSITDTKKATTTKGPTSKSKNNKTKKISASSPNSPSQPKKYFRRSKFQKEKEQAETAYFAKRAATLAKQALDSPAVAKQLLLSMALTRENPRSGKALPESDTIIQDGFYWGDFPPLEQVLRSHMAEYYELSITKCQSRDQQTFNNKLVTLVRAEAQKYGWTFNKVMFDDKKIRDRIRCFFKTHIQNAKKRLNTMVKNPTKKANAKALAAHMDLIEKYNEEELSSRNKKIEVEEKKSKAKLNLCNDDSKQQNNIEGCSSVDGEDDKNIKNVEVKDIDANVGVIEVEGGDNDAHDAAQVLALGFARLSQDSQVIEC